MQAIALLALAFGVTATPFPQGVTESIAPESGPPDGCQTSYDGTFGLNVLNVSDATSNKRSLISRQLDGTLMLTLADSVLKDQAGRTGYIAANYQFQFDDPPQTGAIYTSGFSVCANKSMALGGSAIFYQCLSGDFFNLYDRSWAPHCVPVYFLATGGGSSSGSTASGGAPAPAPPVTQISDGQPQASTGAPVTQISDGQPQAGMPMTQISDGQVQAPTGKPVSQISDGQVQAPTSGGAPVTQISDGQPEAPKTTGAPVTQLSDGQPEAPKTTGAPVTQLSDGQPEAPKTTGAPVTQISDGQPEVATGSAAPATFTGAANHEKPLKELAMFAGIAGAVILL